MERMPALRVAIVGAGPRGLYALERLTSHAACHGTPLTVDVYDPTPTPGAGPVYAPDQPEYLRMNFVAEHVDAWWPGHGIVPASLRRSLVEWVTDAGPSETSIGVPEIRDAGTSLDEEYVPRAVVGRYLHHVFGLVERHTPPCVRLRVRPHTVQSIVPAGDGWRVGADGEQRTYDEVLVTGGHRDADRRSLGCTWSHAAPLVRAVFPVDRWLGVDRVPPGSTVALRGLALTAIDAILALTEGRGGRFEAARTASGLRYVPGPRAPVTIHPYSRTGRPMRPKPEGAVFSSIARRVSGVVTAATERVPAHPDGIAAVEQLVRAVASVAASVLDVAGAGAGEQGRLARWTDALVAGRSGPSERTPRDELARGYAMAVGTDPLDAEAALGIAWRLVHPAVVDRFGGAPLGDDGWRTFRAAAAELERVGFGPCPENVAKLLALVDAGCVVLDRAVGGRLVDRVGTTELRSDGDAVAVDRVIDGVLPGPGVERSGTTPLERLLAADRVAVAPGQRGLRVDPVDATALDREGRRIRGLAAIGRHTEDATIGNDTLNRALHPQVDRWAERIVARAGGGDARRTGDTVDHRTRPPATAGAGPGATAGDGGAPVSTAVGEDGER